MAYNIRELDLPDFTIRISPRNLSDPLNLNKFKIIDKNNQIETDYDFKQKNLLEKILNNFNNGIMRELLKKLNRHDNNKRFYIAGGKALNDYIPLKYNPENPIERNIISFDFDLHIGIFNETPSDILGYINTLLQSARIDMNAVNRFLNNLFEVFNNHPDNNIQSSNGTNLRIIEIDTATDIGRFHAVEIGGVKRIAIPINYKFCEYTNSSVQKYFAFADISTDASFPMLNDLVNIPTDRLRVPSFNKKDDLHQNFKNRIDREPNFTLNLKHNNSTNNLFNYHIIESEGNYTIPIYCVILNIIFYGYKNGYSVFKRQKNQRKLQKLFHHLSNNDLNPRLYDAIISPKTHSWLYKLYSNFPNSTTGTTNTINIVNGILTLKNQSSSTPSTVLTQEEGDLDKALNFLKSVNIICNNISQLFADNYDFSDQIRFLQNHISNFNELEFSRGLQNIENNVILTSIQYSSCSEFYNKYQYIKNLVDNFPKLEIIRTSISDGQSIVDAITYWRGAGHLNINKYLLNIGSVQSVVVDHERNLSRAFQIYRPTEYNDNMYFNADSTDTYKIKQRLDYIKSRPTFAENTRTIVDPSWILTYRVTRYYNIRNMQLSDNDSIEFIIGQNIKDGLYKSTTLSNTIDFSSFYDIEDPCYVFEFIINSNDTQNFIIIENNLQECELLLNKNIDIIIVDISVKNMKSVISIGGIEDRSKVIYRNKYVISCLVLSPVQSINKHTHKHNSYSLNDLYEDNKGLGAYKNAAELHKNLPADTKKLSLKDDSGDMIIDMTQEMAAAFEDSTDMTQRNYDDNDDNKDKKDGDGSYRTKYLKYKNKYLELKAKLNM